MPRHEQYAKFQAAENQFGRLFNQEIGIYRGCFEKEAKSLEEVGIGDQREALRVIGDLTSEYSLYLGSVIDMVHMSVCNHQRVQFCSDVPCPLGRTGGRIKENIASRP